MKEQIAGKKGREQRRNNMLTDLVVRRNYTKSQCRNAQHGETSSADTYLWTESQLLIMTTTYGVKPYPTHTKIIILKKTYSVVHRAEL